METLTILIYGIIFYRYHSKRKLRRTIDIRDRARSDLYLAQLRSKSAPNTPGFGPQSPSYNAHMSALESSNAIKGHDLENGVEDVETRFVEARLGARKDRPFVLQAPPTRSQPTSLGAERAGPMMLGRGFTGSVGDSVTNTESEALKATSAPAGQGEIVYAAVAIPDAYHRTG